MKTLVLSSTPRPNALDYLGKKGIEAWEKERGIRIELTAARPRAFGKRKAGAYRKEFGPRKRTYVEGKLVDKVAA